MLWGCTPATHERTVDDVIESWRIGEQYRVYSPSDDDVEILRKGLQQSLDTLRPLLQDPEPHVRRLTAEAIAELGPAARPVVRDLEQAFLAEDRDLVRGHLVIAIASIGDNSAEAVEFLRSAFDREEQTAVRAYLAGAVVIASEPATELEAWEFLLDCIDPVNYANTTLSPQEEHDLWLPCRAASRMLGMSGARAEPAVPQFESLLADASTPYMVKRQSAEDLELIRNSIAQDD